MAAETTFLKELFINLNNSKIIYCVIRNYEALPEELDGSDLDILIESRYKKETLALIKNAAEKANGGIYWRKWNDHLIINSVCIGTDNRGEYWGVHVDIYIALRWRGLDYFPSELIIERRKLWKGIYVADKNYAILTGYLDKLLYTGKYKNKYSNEAVNAYVNLDIYSKKKIKNIYGNQIDKLLLNNFQSKNSKIMRAIWHTRVMFIIKGILFHIVKYIKNSFICSYIYLTRLLHKPGLIVAFVGLDGSGKTTIIEKVRKEFEILSHTPTYMKHTRPSLLPPLSNFRKEKRGSSVTIKKPHSSPPDGFIRSFARITYYFIDYTIGYLFIVYKTLIKSQTIFIFDRYIYDFIIDPGRHRIDLPIWILKKFVSLIPRPDLVIILDVEPNIAYARKAELPINELINQNKRINKYRFLMKRSIKLKNTDIKTSTSIILKEIFGLLINRK